MIAYWCGFNGFNQISAEKNLFISQFRKIPLNGIKDLSFSWSSALVISEGEIYISGACGKHYDVLTKLTKPDSILEFLKVACNETYALFTSEDECWQYFYNTAEWKKLLNFTVIEKEHNSKYEKSSDATEKRSEPYDKKNSSKIIKICCGEIVNIALDSSGQAYSIPSPITMPGINIKEVSCGFEHYLLLDDFGRVYSLGSGMRGQLGCEVLETVDSPQEIEALSGLCVIQIAAGGWHSAAVTSSGDLYTWGWNNCGQLGFPCVESSDTSECKEHNERSSSDFYSITQNELLVIDQNQTKNKSSKECLGQFIAEKEYEMNVHPQKKMKFSLEKTNLLKDNTENRDMQNIKAKKMDSKDLDKCNSEGAFVEERTFVSVLAVPKAVDFPLEAEIDIVDVSCGNRHTIVLAGNGSVWGCGWNAYGQLGKRPETFGLVDSMISLDIPHDKKVCKVYCGGWNSVLVCNP